MARDYQAEYARRKAKAAERGETVYSKRAQEVRTPAGGVIATFDERRVAAFLRSAKGQPVQVLVDIKNGPQVTIFAHYGWDALSMLADIKAEPDPPRVKRAILKWLDEERGVIGGKRSSKPITRSWDELDEDDDEDEEAEHDSDLIELDDLQRAQFVTVPKRRAAA